MKRFITICAIAVFSTSSALAGSMKELAHYTEINVGQTKADVAIVMHEPGNRELNGNREAWQYCARDGSVNKFVVVYFVDGQVEKLSTYNKRWLGGCSGQYKPVMWDASPALSTEILTKMPVAAPSPTDALVGQ